METTTCPVYLIRDASIGDDEHAIREGLVRRIWREHVNQCLSEHAGTLVFSRDAFAFSMFPTPTAQRLPAQRFNPARLPA